MANIQITQLNPAGFDLLQDQESFLNELNSQEVQTIIGGGHHSKHRSHYSYDSYSDHYHHQKYNSCW